MVVSGTRRQGGTISTKRLRRSDGGPLALKDFGLIIMRRWRNAESRVHEHRSGRALKDSLKWLAACPESAPATKILILIILRPPFPEKDEWIFFMKDDRMNMSEEREAILAVRNSLPRPEALRKTQGGHDEL